VSARAILTGHVRAIDVLAADEAQRKRADADPLADPHAPHAVWEASGNQDQRDAASQPTPALAEQTGLDEAMELAGIDPPTPDPASGKTASTHPTGWPEATAFGDDPWVQLR
jgi:hypothetical protein